MHRVPEHDLWAAVWETTLRDVGLLCHNDVVSGQGVDRYYRLKAACDWYFDDDSKDEVGSAWWVLRSIPNVNAGKVIALIRNFILEYWTVERVELLIQKKLDDKVRLDVTILHELS